MGKRTNKGVVVASSSGIVIGTGAKNKIHIGPRMRMVLLWVLVVVVVLGGVGTYMYRKHVDHEAVVARQNKLQNAVIGTNGAGDTSQLKTDSTSLIQGAKDGIYNISDKQLAAAYAARGDAELNSGNNKSAVADYEQAVKIDPSMQTNVGYGEFLARYRLGERKTLIPLLRQLAAPLKNNKDSQLQDDYARYEDYISSLQQGQDLEL